MNLVLTFSYIAESGLAMDTPKVIKILFRCVYNLNNILIAPYRYEFIWQVKFGVNSTIEICASFARKLKADVVTWKLDKGRHLFQVF